MYLWGWGEESSSEQEKKGGYHQKKEFSLKQKLGHWYQGLIQKKKVHIDCEKDAQISILANKIAKQW